MSIPPSGPSSLYSQPAPVINRKRLATTSAEDLKIEDLQEKFTRVLKPTDDFQPVHNTRKTSREGTSTPDGVKQNQSVRFVIPIPVAAQFKKLLQSNEENASAGFPFLLSNDSSPSRPSTPIPENEASSVSEESDNEDYFGNLFDEKL